MTKCPSCFTTLPTNDGQSCHNCKRRLPENWRGATTTCIAMAGARATGKSIYIAVLVKQLQQSGEFTGTTVLPADEHTERTFAEHYERPLYRERGLVQSTRSASEAAAHQREPLIFSVRSPTGEQSFLVIRDVAGEDLEVRTPDASRLGFFARADGVLFLFDPLKVPDVREYVRDLVPYQKPGGDPQLVLENVLRLVGYGTPRFALVVAKFDTMQQVGKVRGNEWSLVMQNAGAAYTRDPGPVAPYDNTDGELLHEEIRSMLQRLYAGAMVGRIQGSGMEHRFFAVSALGESPRGELLNVRGIAPFRCLDPLKWVMSPKPASRGMPVMGS